MCDTGEARQCATMELRRIESFDGTGLAVHELGEGRPVILLHGFLSSARANWERTGLAQALARAGRRVIAPDLRGHGDSDAPVGDEAWPPDVLARDQVALVAALGLSDYDLAGYSLGARTAVRAVAGGLRPRRMVLGGMGDTGVMEAGPRAAMFEDAIRNGERAADPRAGRHIANLMAAAGLNSQAMLGVLASFHPTAEAEIAAINAPTLVILGRDDHDNGSAERLAALLPRGEVLRVPGDHAGAVASMELRQAMTDFLA